MPSSDRLAFWGSLGLLGLGLGGATLLAASDRAAVRAAQTAWRERGERPPAPPAVSGGTRAFQAKH